jgi:hypothetical protein
VGRRRNLVATEGTENTEAEKGEFDAGKRISPMRLSPIFSVSSVAFHPLWVD